MKKPHNGLRELNTDLKYRINSSNRIFPSVIEYNISVYYRNQVIIDNMIYSTEDIDALESLIRTLSKKKLKKSLKPTNRQENYATSLIKYLDDLIGENEDCEEGWMKMIRAVIQADLGEYYDGWDESLEYIGSWDWSSIADKYFNNLDDPEARLKYRRGMGSGDERPYMNFQEKIDDLQENIKRVKEHFIEMALDEPDEIPYPEFKPLPKL